MTDTPRTAKEWANKVYDPCEVHSRYSCMVCMPDVFKQAMEQAETKGFQRTLNYGMLQETARSLRERAAAKLRGSAKVFIAYSKADEVTDMVKELAIVRSEQCESDAVNVEALPLLVEPLQTEVVAVVGGSVWTKRVEPKEESK